LQHWLALNHGWLITSSDAPIFGIDWWLGKTVAQAVIDVPVEHYSDHFRQDTFDTEWLSVVAIAAGLTKDQAMEKK
jgi:hypothetical protein